jgi:Kef-type K+ transport system membrane component KefB
MEAFIELAGVIAVAMGFAFVMKLLRQPLVVGYILAGIFVGPNFLHLLVGTEHIELFSKIGITILLFIVGLSLNPNVIRQVGKVSLLGGLGQVFFTTLIGFVISLFLGIEKIAALYIAIALTFSSTIIILKLLSDKGDMEKLYGKIAIGFLLVQDIIATIILVGISSFSTASATGIWTQIGFILVKGIGIMIVLYLLSTYLLPRLIHFLASSPELLFLFSIMWGLMLSTVFYWLGFSIEIGALLAGVTISLTPFADGIASRLRPLRDFFIVLFFVLLGSEMILDNLFQILVPTLILSLFVLIGNPVIVVILMNLLGYKRRTAFQAGLTMAQISEFSLILATLGFNMGHLTRSTLSLITLVGLITIAGSSYLILYSEKIYPWVEKWLRFLEFKKNRKEMHGSTDASEIMLFGFDRVGRDFINVFKKLGKRYLVIDFNPELIADMQRSAIPYKFGDVEDVEFLHELNFSEVKLFVSTIPDVKVNALLLKEIRKVNTHAVLIVLSHDIKDAKHLYSLGATYVIMPHYLGARYATHMLSRFGFDRKGFEEEKEKHLEDMEKRELVLTS